MDDGKIGRFVTCGFVCFGIDRDDDEDEEDVSEEEEVQDNVPDDDKSDSAIFDVTSDGVALASVASLESIS